MLLIFKVNYNYACIVFFQCASVCSACHYKVKNSQLCILIKAYRISEITYLLYKYIDATKFRGLESLIVHETAMRSKCYSECCHRLSILTMTPLYTVIIMRLFFLTDNNGTGSLIKQTYLIKIAVAWYNICDHSAEIVRVASEIYYYN